jgi:hypothetical protein
MCHEECGEQVSFDEEHGDPAELHWREVLCAAQALLAAGWILPRRSEPLEHQREPHDHIAADNDCVVYVLPPSEWNMGSIPMVRIRTPHNLEHGDNRSRTVTVMSTSGMAPAYC